MSADALAAQLSSALAHRRAGRQQDAERVLRQVLDAHTGHSGAAHLLGVMALERDDATAALAWLDIALPGAASLPALHFNRGIALSALSRLDEAKSAYRRCLALDPGMPEAHFNLGNVLAGTGDKQAAIDAYRQALRLRPALADAWRALGKLHASASRWQDAADDFGQLLALAPTDADAWNRRGVALHQLGQVDDALACYERALALLPGSAESWNNRGNALHDLRRVDAAIKAYEQAFVLDPELPEASANMGMLQQETGCFDQARESYRRAQALRPNYAEATRRLAGLDLLQGRFAQGWAGFEQALDDAPAVGLLGAAPRWRGEPLAGKRILLSEPNGLGDTIQFFRFIPRLVDAGAEVAFFGPASIRHLLCRFEPMLRFVDDAAAAYDYQAMLWSLPHYLGIGEGDVGMDAPWLLADPTRVARWSHLAEPGAVNIGICWQGNPRRKIDRLRSIPLASFRAVAQVPGVRLVSLQRGAGVEQLDALPEDMNVIVPGAGFDDGADAFADTLALMQRLDLVLSADTAVTHVAAASGRPAWLALAKVPDWRWMLGREDSPWYPTVRLFRQRQLDDWTGVMEQVAAALRAAHLGSRA
ncbi:tetratricopeptide repeat protein [soil metagenome]